MDLVQGHRKLNHALVASIRATSMIIAAHQRNLALLSFMMVEILLAIGLFKARFNLFELAQVRSRFIMIKYWLSALLFVSVLHLETLLLSLQLDVHASRWSTYFTSIVTIIHAII